MGQAKAETQKITANLNAKLLQRVRKQSKLGITEVLNRGLEEFDRALKREKLRGLAGKVHFDLDLELTRSSPAYEAELAEKEATTKISGTK